MKLSAIMSKADWLFVKATAGVFALIVAAIGTFETEWGKNPNSPGRDWLLGYDFYEGPGGMQEKYRGFTNQVIAVCEFLNAHMAQPINAHNLYMFSRNAWKAGTTQANRDAWSKGVWAIHAEIYNDYDGTGLVPEWRPKFGRKKKTEDARDLAYKKYRTTLPTRPATFGHESLIGADAWGMLGNDEYGDCVFAGADHETMYWTTEAGDPATFTAANTEADYFAVTGGQDDGCEIRTALQYRTNTGVIDASGKRHKIGGYVSLNETDLDEVDEAAYIFEGVELGINVTQGMMDAFNTAQPWTAAACKGDSLGGHDVPYLGTDGTWLYVVTWGQIQQLDPAGYPLIVEEAWAILSPDMLVNGATVDGVNLASLQADLAAITTDPIPAPGPAPTPPPTPPPAPTVDSIAVTPAMSSIAVGATVQLTTKATMSDGSTKDVTATCNWQSADEDAATVNAGLVTGVSSDTVAIIALVGNISSSAEVTVTPASGTTIVLNVGTIPSVIVAGGSNQAMVNGAAKRLEDVPFLADNLGRVYVGIRDVAELLGCIVTWDEATMTVTIFQPAADSASAEYVEEFPAVTGHRRAR